MERSATASILLILIAAIGRATSQELHHPFPNVTCEDVICVDEDDGPNPECPVANGPGGWCDPCFMEKCNYELQSMEDCWSWLCVPPGPLPPPGPIPPPSPLAPYITAIVMLSVSLAGAFLGMLIIMCSGRARAACGRGCQALGKQAITL